MPIQAVVLNDEDHVERAANAADEELGEVHCEVFNVVCENSVSSKSGRERRKLVHSYKISRFVCLQSVKVAQQDSNVMSSCCFKILEIRNVRLVS